MTASRRTVCIAAALAILASCKSSSAESCSPANCAGCCQGSVWGSVCEPGAAAALCGSGGEACAACGGGVSCTAGKCASGAQCDASNCAGCCAGGQCVAATDPTACGAAGSACCPSGQTCQSGACAAQPPMPNYPQKVLANDAPYIDSNAQYLFKITVGGGHWAAFSLTAPKSATPIGLALYSASGTLVATTQKDWSCGTSSANQTGFIALNGNNLTAGTVLYGVVHAGGQQYVAEWYEAPLMLAEASTCTTSACAPFPTGHVAHVFDVTMRAGDNYAIHGGCSGACSSTNQNFQFVVRSRGAAANFATGSDYLSVSPTCSGCGSEQVGIAADPADDALHGVIAVQAYGQGQPSVTECLNLEAKSCAAPLTLCDPACADTQTDVNHCGASCTDCTASVSNAQGITCSAGVCDYGSCNANYGNCTASRENGCPTYLPGTCSGVLNATGLTCDTNGCNYGTCNNGYLDCDGNRKNGCEVNVAAFLNVTGVTCSASGAGPDYSACSSGHLDCDGNRANGCEATLTALETSMHATGITCSSSGPDYTTCDSGYFDCDGNRGNGCETLTTGCAQRLATAGATSYQQLVLDSNNVYWTEGTSVKKVALAGGVPALVASSVWSFGIAVDSNNVYFVEHATGQLVAVSLTGGTAPTFPKGTDVYDVAVNATDLYWTNAASGNGWVSRVSLSGGSATRVNPQGGAPDALVLDATNFYWYDGTYVWQESLATGGSALKLGQAGPEPVGLAVDVNHVYWASGAGVSSVPIGGGTLTTIANLAATGAVAVDATRVYWSRSDGTGVFATTKDGSTSTPLPPDFDGSPALSIAVDAANVYWLTSSSIFKAPKP